MRNWSVQSRRPALTTLDISGRLHPLDAAPHPDDPHLINWSCPFSLLLMTDKEGQRLFQPCRTLFSHVPVSRLRPQAERRATLRCNAMGSRNTERTIQNPDPKAGRAPGSPSIMTRGPELMRILERSRQRIRLGPIGQPTDRYVPLRAESTVPRWRDCRAVRNQELARWNRVSRKPSVSSNRIVSTVPSAPPRIIPGARAASAQQHGHDRPHLKRPGVFAGMI